MESEELLRRADDLLRRCDRSACVTGTAFLTPAEQAELAAWARRQDCRLIFRGGHPDCERKAAFFLPDYLEEADFPEADYLCALRAEAGFGAPGHRDYLGAALGLGIRRDFLGDIWVDGSAAVIFCLPTVARLLRDSLDKVGRFGVRLRDLPLDEIPAPERRVQEKRFTVQSLRLDAVLSGLFSVSRTKAADLIAAGAAAKNYLPCLKADAPVAEGDVLSLRGHGKGTLAEIGGSSRKGRLFLRAELYL